jgi:hypothetical protein
LSARSASLRVLPIAIRRSREGAGVGVAGALDDGDAMESAIQLSVPSVSEPVADVVPGPHRQRGGAGVAGVGVLVLDAGDVGGLAEDLGGVSTAMPGRMSGVGASGPNRCVTRSSVSGPFAAVSGAPGFALAMPRRSRRVACQSFHHARNCGSAGGHGNTTTRRVRMVRVG